MKSKSSVSVRLAAAVLAAACGANPAFAEGVAGMTVTRDAETGMLRAPTADEMKALEAARKTNSRITRPAASAPVTHPNGTVSVLLGEDQMMYSVARVNAQGKLERACVQGLEASQQAMKAPASFAVRLQLPRAAHAAAPARIARELPDEK